MRLKNYINEAVTAKATNMEDAIVKVWNKQPVPQKYKNLEEKATEVVEFLKSKGLTGKATHMGGGKSKLTSQWLKYGAKNKTPKTDLMIGRYRISLKQKGGSQLISAGREEVMSLFYTVAENMGITDRLEEELSMELDMFMKIKVKGDLTTGSIKKGEGTYEEQQAIKDMDEFNRRFKKILENKFDEDPTFHHEIIREATTGFNKFGKGSDAAAEYILVFDNKGDNHYFGKIDDQYVSKLASHSNINVSFKSMSQSSKGVKAWRQIYNALRIVIKEEKELNENIFKKIGSGIKKMWKGFVKSIKGIFDFLGISVDIKGKITF